MINILFCIILGLLIIIVILLLLFAHKEVPKIPKKTIDLKKHFPKLKADYVNLKEFYSEEAGIYYKVEYGFYSLNVDDMSA